MNAYNPQIHHRRSIRLRGYDYTQSGAYFVTICTQGRACLFGHIVNDEMQLNDAGRMVQTVWESMPGRFPNATFDIYVIMPNHFHAIVIINDQPVGATLVVAQNAVVAPNGVAPSPTDVPNGAGTSPAPTNHPTLGAMVGAFKSITTHEYIVGIRTSGWPPFDRRIWQRNYWEHIIRTPESHARIEDYIRLNPARWQADQLHPAAPLNPSNQERSMSKGN